MNVTDKQILKLQAFLKEHPKLLSAKCGERCKLSEKKELWRKMADIVNAVPGGSKKDWKSWRQTVHRSRTKMARGNFKTFLFDRIKKTGSFLSKQVQEFNAFKVNKEQKLILMKYLKKHPTLARHRINEGNMELWKSITEVLNNVPLGSQKSWKEWRKAAYSMISAIKQKRLKTFVYDTERAGHVTPTSANEGNSLSECHSISDVSDSDGSEKIPLFHQVYIKTDEDIIEEQEPCPTAKLSPGTAAGETSYRELKTKCPVNAVSERTKSSRSSEAVTEKHNDYNGPGNSLAQHRKGSSQGDCEIIISKLSDKVKPAQFEGIQAIVSEEPTISESSQGMAKKSASFFPDYKSKMLAKRKYHQLQKIQKITSLSSKKFALKEENLNRKMQLQQLTNKIGSTLSNLTQILNACVYK